MNVEGRGMYNKSTLYSFFRQEMDAKGLSG